VNRLQIIAVLGCVALEACSASDEVTERPAADAGRDVKTTARPDVQTADQLDASGGSYADEASTVPDPDVAAPDTTSPPPDDGTVPPPDATSPPSDGTVPPRNDGSLPPPIDAGPDQTVSSCLVTFTVNGVQWALPEGGADAQVTGRVVRLVGDATNIGAWAPAAGVVLTETAPGIWSGTATFRDQQLTEFKFVKLEGATPEWESWLPYDSNRSLRVECFGDGGVFADAADAADGDVFTVTDGATDSATDHDGPPAADVAGDAGASDGASDGSADGGATDANADVQDSGAPGDAGVVPVPARGRAYVGVFGVRPLDATK
jgi:hypothetical protein